MLTIAVIGAGPAGCASIQSLLNAHLKNPCNKYLSFNILVFDSGNERNQIIGETIPPATTPILYQLGFAHTLAFEKHLECPGSISVWGSDTPGHNDFFFNPVGKGYHLDRVLFEQELLQAIQPDVTHFPQHRLIEVQTLGNQFRLVFKQADNSKQQWLADFVIDASGISAAFARRIEVARNELDQVLSLCLITDCPVHSSIGFHTLLEAVENGWWYAAKLPRNKVIVSLCSDKNTIKADNLKQTDQWLAALKKTRLIKSKIDLNELTTPFELNTKVAASAILSKVIGNNWVAVGDAASSYDSISSAGITKALSNGLHAGAALYESIAYRNAQALVDYELALFDAFNQYAQLRNDIYKSEKRFANSNFWRNRLELYTGRTSATHCEIK